MMKGLYKYRFLISRRIVQLLLLLLFLGGNLYTWKILQGNYSAGSLFDKVPLADPYATLQIFATGFVAGSDIILGALLVLALYGIFFGRMFCSWICPMNIVADSAVWGSKKLGFKNTLTFSRKTRYGIMVLGLILSSLLGMAAFELISPIAMLHRGVIFGIGSAWAVILAIFLFDLAVMRYGWCGHLCPLGAFYALVGRFALIKVRHNADNCTNCRKCLHVCHEAQVLSNINIKSGHINSSECTNCMRCIEVCEDHALKLSVRNPFTTNKEE